jgi:methylamine dehydrogenase accessory protein MauD
MELFMSLILDVSYVLLWMLVILLMISMFALARQIGVIHLRLPPRGARAMDIGPEIGTAAPEIRTNGIDGRELLLGGIQDKNTLIVFISPGCPSCRQLAPAIRSIHARESNSWEVFIVTGETDVQANQRFIRENRLSEIRYISSKDVSKAYKVGGTPYAVVLDQRGIVQGKGLVNTPEQIESLLNALELAYPMLDEFMRDYPDARNSNILVSGSTRVDDGQR